MKHFIVKLRPDIWTESRISVDVQRAVDETQDRLNTA